jgi:hypothetical protein
MLRGHGDSVRKVGATVASATDCNAFFEGAWAVITGLLKLVMVWTSLNPASHVSLLALVLLPRSV